MKKALLLVILLVATYCNLLAQRRLSLEIHAGVGISNLRAGSERRNGNSNSKFATNGGLGLEASFDKQWSTQIEVNYQNVGGGKDPELLIPLIGYKRYQLEYLSLPVLAKFKVPKTNIGLYLGPQYSYLINSKFENPYGVAERRNQMLHKSDFAFVAGVEYLFQINGNQLGLSGRYQHGFSDVGKSGEGDSSIKNRAFTISLGYRFSL